MKMNHFHVTWQWGERERENFSESAAQSKYMFAAQNTRSSAPRNILSACSLKCKMSEPQNTLSAGCLKGQCHEIFYPYLVKKTLFIGPLRTFSINFCFREDIREKYEDSVSVSHQLLCLHTVVVDYADKCRHSR